jgi:hypothetical protein
MSKEAADSWPKDCEVPRRAEGLAYSPITKILSGLERGMRPKVLHLIGGFQNLDPQSELT